MENNKVRKLNKLEISEFLRNYAVLIMKTKYNISKSIKDVVIELFQESGYEIDDNDLKIYYQQMIRIYEVYNLITIITLLKDEFLPFLKRDQDMNNALAFLDNCFINKSDSCNFNKLDIINYIRNAFNHNNENNLYYVNSDGSININLDGKNLHLKLEIDDLRKICDMVLKYSYHGFVTVIKNKDEIDIEKFKLENDKCIKELQKIRLFKFRNKNKTSINCEEKLGNIDKEKDTIMPIDFIDINKEFNIFEQKLTKEQCETVAYKLKKMNIQLENFYFYVIISVLEEGSYKLARLNFNNFIVNNYLYNWENSLEVICYDMVNHITRYIEHDESSILLKYIDFGNLNKMAMTINYVYLLEYILEPECALFHYFTYVYSNFKNKEENEVESHIRNALVHKRYFYHNTDSSKDIYFYDNYDDIRKPTTLSDTTWKKCININDLREKVDEIINYYLEKENLSIKKKIK